MKKIYFQHVEQVMFFCDSLFQAEKQLQVKWKKRQGIGHELILKDRVLNDSIAACFQALFEENEMHALMLSIIQHSYYYRAKADIEAIVHWTNWIIEEKIYAHRLYEGHGSLQAYMIAMWKAYLEKTDLIYFDAMLTFHRKKMKQCLQYIVGYGIDEMKREEEYYEHIDAIRTYVQQTEAKTDRLYIVVEDTFYFYRVNGRPYTRLELKEKMLRTPLYMFQLDMHDLHIAPMMALLPKEIYIYAREKWSPSIQLLLQTFQERITLLPINSFPFVEKRN